MVDLELDDGVAVITIDRPHARNAIALATMDDLEKALDAAAGAKALVITGAGDRAFVSGGDLKELSTIRTELAARSMAQRMRGICDRIADFPAPVIAALNGHALGGGVRLGIEFPFQFAARLREVDRNQVIRKRGDEIHHAVDGEHRRLLALERAGGKRVRDLEVLHVAGVDLVESAVTCAGVVARRHGPVAVLCG
jgi:hypothetical protein